MHSCSLAASLRRARARRRRMRQQQRQQHRAPALGSAAAPPRGTVNGAGSTFAAPVYQQWGSTLRARASRSTTRPSARAPASPRSRQGTADFAGSDPALTPEDRKTLKKGDAVQIPMFFGAITVVLQRQRRRRRASSSTARRSPTSSSGKIKTWNDPAIAKLNPRRAACRAPRSRSSTAPTSRARRRASRPSSPPTAREWKSKVGADKTVKWPTGTGAKGNDGVAAAVKQTDGADRLRRAGLRAAEQLHVPPTSRTSRASSSRRRWTSTSAAGEGSRSRPTSASATIDAPGADRLPDHLADVHRRLQGPLQGRHEAGRRQGARRLPRLRPRRRARRASASCSTRSCPRRCWPSPRRPRSRSTCNGSALGA